MKNSFLQKTKKTFIPCTENNYKPAIFGSKSSILISGVVVILFFTLLNIQNIYKTFHRVDNLFDVPQIAAIIPSVLVDLANQERIESGVGELVENELLNQAATLKAENMATLGYFAHTSPDGRRPWHWLQDVGYTYRFAGENLAVNFVDSKELTIAWMNSPKHRANILKAEYKEIGIGVATGTFNDHESIFVVQVFASPFVESENIASVGQSLRPLSDGMNNFFTYLVFNNHNVINLILMGILVVVVILLVLQIFIKFKVQNKKLIINALLVIALLVILILINNFLSDQRSENVQFSTFQYTIGDEERIDAE